MAAVKAADLSTDLPGEKQCWNKKKLMSGCLGLHVLCCCIYLIEARCGESPHLFPSRTMLHLTSSLINVVVVFHGWQLISGLLSQFVNRRMLTYSVAAATALKSRIMYSSKCVAMPVPRREESGNRWIVKEEKRIWLALLYCSLLTADCSVSHLPLAPSLSHTHSNSGFSLFLTNIARRYNWESKVDSSADVVAAIVWQSSSTSSSLFSRLTQLAKAVRILVRRVYRISTSSEEGAWITWIEFLLPLLLCCQLILPSFLSP